MVMRSPLLLLLIGLLPMGCSSDSDLYQHSASAPVISVDGTVIDDRIHVVWAEKPEEGNTRGYHSVSDDGGASWSDPVYIDTDQPGPDRVRRDNDLRVRSHGDQLLVIWQASGGGFQGAGPMQLAQSDDGGQSWSVAEAPPDADKAEAHGFFALETLRDGYHLAWLDNRSGQQGLHYAHRSGEGDWSEVETVVDATCQCCWNSLADDGDQVWLLYRALSPRDMSLAVRDQGDWTRQGAVADFNWQIDGCPHVGGALARIGEEAPHALTWTGDDTHQGLFHVTPSGSRQRLGGENARNGDLIAVAQEQLLAVWDERGKGIQAQWLHDSKGPMTLSKDPQRQPSHPVALDTPQGARVLWTEPDADNLRTWVLAPLPDQ